MAYKQGAREEMAKRLGVTWATPDRISDIHAGEPWSEMATEDLQEQWKTGADLEELSRYLCRDWEEVARKCAELDLDLVHQPQRRRGFLAKQKEPSGQESVGRIVTTALTPAEQIEASYNLTMVELADYLTQEQDAATNVDRLLHILDSNSLRDAITRLWSTLTCIQGQDLASLSIMPVDLAYN